MVLAGSFGYSGQAPIGTHLRDSQLVKPRPGSAHPGRLDITHSLNPSIPCDETPLPDGLR